jgi:hypothetical protein
MSTNNGTIVNGGFPLYIKKQLDQPPPGHPGRHEAWERLSYQMVGERIPDAVIFDALRAWIPDKDKTDKELRTLIAGARAKNPQPAAGAGSAYSGGTYRAAVLAKPTFTKPANTVPLPADLEETTPAQFLSRVYCPDDLVCVTFPVKGKPIGDEIRTDVSRRRRRNCQAHRAGFRAVQGSGSSAITRVARQHNRARAAQIPG